MLSLALASVLIAAPVAPDCGALAARYFADSRAAFQSAIEGGPTVIGVGEYHAVQGRGPKVRSAISRFTESLLPSLKGRAGHLVAETWIKSGRCGQVEKQAVAQIEKEARRPAETEDEVTSMLEKASDLGLEPHILKVECDDYVELLDAGGELDNVKLLALVTRLLREKALALAARERSGPRTRGPPVERPSADRSGSGPRTRGPPVERPSADRSGSGPRTRGPPVERPPADRSGSGPRTRGPLVERPPADRSGSGAKAVVLYGGALHNELEPSEDLADFSFAPALRAALGERYRQVTLLVPELVEADPTAHREVWFSCLERYASVSRTLLIRRGEARFLVFPRTTPAPSRRR